MEKIQSRIGNQGPQLTLRLKIGAMLHYRHLSERASLGFSRSMIGVFYKGSKLAFVGVRGGALYLIFEIEEIIIFQEEGMGVSQIEVFLTFLNKIRHDFRLQPRNR
jgi:hypothetical protein